MLNTKVTSGSFHVVHVKHNGQHLGYEIYFAAKHPDVGIFFGVESDEPVVELRDGVRLKKHEAYELARRWNFG